MCSRIIPLVVTVITPSLGRPDLDTLDLGSIGVQRSVPLWTLLADDVGTDSVLGVGRVAVLADILFIQCLDQLWSRMRKQTDSMTASGPP